MDGKGTGDCLLSGRGRFSEGPGLEFWGLEETSEMLLDEGHIAKALETKCPSRAMGFAPSVGLGFTNTGSS